MLPISTGLFGIEGQYDIVRATFTDGTNVPRIPPQRLGGGAYWRDINWLAKVNLLHAFDQTNVSAVETTTPGYNRLRAELSYTSRSWRISGFGLSSYTIGVIGDNLLNEGYPRRLLLHQGRGAAARQDHPRVREYEVR